MASFGNSPNPWASSYDTYKDCSQGLCSIYCPQWCYIIFPPPPPPFGDFDSSDDDSSRADFSPLIIAVIGILASAFILLTYYTIISKYCRRQNDNSNNERGLGDNSNNNDDNDNDNDNNENDNSAGQAASSLEGLEEGLIKAIRVYKYRKSDGLVDGADCAVCLSEFEENEGLRLLPKCNHAFHVPCIDRWLKSHSSCPLCRANIAPLVGSDEVVVVVAAMPQVVQSSVSSYHSRSSEVGHVVVVVDDEQDSHVGVIREEESLGPKICLDDRDDQPIARRSVSLNVGHGFCSDRVLVADILREDEDDEDLMARMESRMELSLGIGTSSKGGSDDHDDECDQICKWDKSGTLGLMRSPLAMRRSISTSRFVFTRYGKGKNSVLPN